MHHPFMLGIPCVKINTICTNFESQIINENINSVHTIRPSCTCRVNMHCHFLNKMKLVGPSQVLHLQPASPSGDSLPSPPPIWPSIEHTEDRMI